VDAGKLLTLLPDDFEDGNAERGDVNSIWSDVMPLAASSSLTRPRYVMSG